MQDLDGKQHSHTGTVCKGRTCGLYRDPVTHEPHEYYCKLPESIDERISVIVDPMLATGGSAEAAIDFVKKQGGKNIKFMCIIAAPEGLKRLHEAHPDVQIYCGSLTESSMRTLTSAGTWRCRRPYFWY